MRSRTGRFLRGALLLAFVVACGDSGPSEPDGPGAPASIAVAPQFEPTHAYAGDDFGPLIATVLDAEGRAVPGAAVTWTTEDGTLAPAAGTTDASGRTQTTWTLAPRTGLQTLHAEVGDLSASLEVDAELSGVNTLVFVAGGEQEDTIDATLDTLVVELRSPAGVPMPGFAATWSLLGDEGSIVPLDGTTDENGRARAVWTVGPTVAMQFVRVSVAGQVADAVATVQPGAPARIASFMADSTSLDKWGETISLHASVEDRRGNLLPGDVTFTSSDTTVLRLTQTHAVSHRAGSATLTALFEMLTRDFAVRVHAQRNSACIQPIPIQRGAPAAVPSFGAAQILTHLPAQAWDGARSLAVDYDGDGDDDVIRLEYSYPSSPVYSGEVRVFRADAGGLVDVTDSMGVAGIVPDHPRDFEVRDFDGDGREEAYVAQHGYDANPFPGAPNLYLELVGDSIDDRATDVFAGMDDDAFSHGSSSADVDCDGDLDVVELNVSQNEPNLLWLNGGAGSFTRATAAQFPISDQHQWQEVAFIDFDGDVDPDIFLGALSGQNVHALLVNDGFGNFRRWDGVVFPGPVFTPNQAANNVKAADFDGNGYVDLFLMEIPQPFSTQSAPRLWLNQGGAVFVDASTDWGLPATCSAELIEPLYQVDINRDLWPDLTLPTGCPELGQTGLLVNQGAGFTVWNSSSIEPWLEFDPITPADVDGDGDLDLWYGEHGGNPVLVEQL